MAKTMIEWADYTLNFWNGCTAIGPGCDNCYAEARDQRFGKGVAPHFGVGKPRQLHAPATRFAPRKWNREPFHECPCGEWRGTMAEFPPHWQCPEYLEHGLLTVRPRVFAQSLSDTFDNEVEQAWRDELFALMEECTNLDWLVLTKRIGNVRRMVPMRWLVPGAWPKHIRLGITVVNQEEADRDIPKLLDLPCRNFLSMEPLIAAVDISKFVRCPVCAYTKADGGLQMDHHLCTKRRGGLARWVEWVIVGGESGRSEGIRPMHPGWVRMLRDQCVGAGVPFLFKQWGEFTPAAQVDRITGTVEAATLYDDKWVFWDENLARHDHPDEPADLYRIGKKHAGRSLDGRTWDQFPEVAL